ncbi:MAG: hypothetical protein K9M54_08785, partial [Kiritimatiellales bacterium]|nr:hypothetical protein [Kiritimatiellales bacterium]
MNARYRWSMIVACVAGLATANASTLTWDIVPGTVGAGDNAITIGDGTWDTSTGNWTIDEGTNNIAWVNGSDAYFSSGQTISLASGVTVGGIALKNGPVNLKAAVDNTALTVVGSPTWDLKSRTLGFINDQVNDTALAMAAGQTLTVTGTTGTLDTGEKPNGADWAVGGATLDFQATAGTLKGNKASVGNFSLVKMAGGSLYIHERNNGETYTNNWELGAGTVTLDNRWSKGVTFGGVISGDGGLQVTNFAGQTVVLSAGNTFKGGLTIDDTVVLGSITADSQLGDAAGSVTLKNGTAMVLIGVTLSGSRTIFLDNGGT